MNKKTKLSIVLGVCLAYLVAIVAVPLTSYLNYQKEVDELVSEKIEEDNKTLKEVKVSLKEGVEYFNNGRANPSKDDLIVSAIYGGTYTDPVETILNRDDYELEIPSYFARFGGSLKVTYQKKKTELKIDLTEVIVTSLNIVENPYTITYAVNDTFNSEGMVVEGVYNDGSRKTISKYEVATSESLTKDIIEVEITYTEGESNVSTKLPITVLDSVDNGDIKSLSACEESVKNGEKLTAVTVLAHYENGNRIVLNSSEYSLVSDEIASLGKQYNAKVTLNSNENITADVPVSVFEKIEAENAGGLNTKNTKDVTEYIFDEEGKIVNNGTVKVNNGGFKTRMTNYDPSVEKTLNFDFNAGNHTNGDLIVRAANFNWSGDAMNITNFKNMFEFYVNGREVSFGNDAIIPAFNVPSDFVTSEGIKAQDIGYNVFFDIVLADVNLLNGTNNIEFKLRFTEDVELNTFGETADIKMDYFKVVVDNHIPAHSLKHVEQKEPTCNEKGNVDHYHCSTCGETYLDEGCSQIILNPTLESGNHQYGDYRYNDEKHTQECEICHHTLEENHLFDTIKNDSSKHWEECVCGKIVNEESHQMTELKAKSTKVYNVGDPLDSTAFEATTYCKCGVKGTTTSDYQVSFNETAASNNSTATFSYKGKEFTFPIPVSSLRLEAESSFASSQSNYRVSISNSKVEEAKGKDGTASVGVQSKDSQTSTPNLKDSTITMTINSDIERRIYLSMLAASCYNGNASFKLEDVADLMVNGETQEFASNASFNGGSTKWFGWENVNVADINLKAGENVITITIHYDLTKLTDIQTSGDGPFNIDYFKINYL